MEILVRLGSFAGVFALLAFLEYIAPRRKRPIGRKPRWFGNLAIVAINTAVIRLAFPLVAVGVALVSRQREWGLFNNVNVPGPVAFVLSVVLLDFVVYLQHVMFHAVPLLWRIHRMHHADRDLDVTSGLRFHPLEIVLSMLLKMVAVLLIGPSLAAVVTFEVLLNATSMFNHSNFYIPLGFDRILRWFVVTPDMHRVHHSVRRDETDSNFGFNLPWWDRLLGTYRAQPREGHDGMTIGLSEYLEQDTMKLRWMLLVPFR